MDKKNITSEITQEVQLIKFDVGGTVFCLPLEVVDEVFPTLTPTKIAYQDPSIDGIVIPRDFILIIVDLAKFFNIEHKIREERLIAVTYGGNKVGLKVDGVLGILSANIYREFIELQEEETLINESKDNKNLSNIELEYDERYQMENYYEKYNDILAGYAIIDKKQIIVLDHIKLIKRMRSKSHYRN